MTDDRPQSSPALPPPVQLEYEPPAEYRIKSDLPPPGWSDFLFWKFCYRLGRLLRIFVK